jgi:hypothetical protein
MNIKTSEARKIAMNTFEYTKLQYTVSLFFKHRLYDNGRMTILFIVIELSEYEGQP